MAVEVEEISRQMGITLKERVRAAQYTPIHGCNASNEYTLTPRSTGKSPHWWLQERRRRSGRGSRRSQDEN